MAVEISPPFPVFADDDGVPLEDGYIYIGAVNQNPQVVPLAIFWDSALTIPAAQPIRTLGGYPARSGTPSRMYISESAYSIAVTNKNGTLIYSDMNNLAGDVSLRNDLANATDPNKGASLIGRSVVSVASMQDMPGAKQDPSITYITSAYYPGLFATADPSYSSGSCKFKWDPNVPRSSHNGGTIISPSMVWDGTKESLPAFLTSPVDAALGCFVAVREQTGVCVEQFGAVPSDETFAVSNYAAMRAAIKFAIRPDGPGTGAFRLECQEEVLFGSGNYFVEGNSLFCFSRTELESFPGNYRFRRGIRYRGQGRDGTILTLKNTGVHTWFYNTADVNFPGDTSVMDQVEFSGLTLRSYDYLRKYVVAEASKISGFRMETYGWEKFFAFKDVRFEGFDRCIQYSGNGNADHNTFYGCQFTKVKDAVFFINNNQSIQTRLYGCDMEEIFGNCFEVFENGGGDVHMYGGSIILMPRYLGTNLPDLGNTTPRAFCYVFQNATDATIGFGNNIFDFNGLRFEMYDDFQKLAYAIKDGTSPGGSIDVNFNRCNFNTDKNKDAADVTIEPIAATKSAVVLNNNLRGNVRFNQAQLIKRHVYNINGTTSTFAPSRVMFYGCELQWDPAADTADGGLYTKCTASTNGAFAATGTTSIGNQGAGDERTRVVLDFQKGIESAPGGFAFHSVVAQVKSLAVKWPVPTDTKPRVYLPPGAIVTDVTINKPAFTPSGTPATNYGLVLQDSAAATIYATSTGSEEREIVVNSSLATPKVIGAAPNNFIQLTAVGSGLTQTQSFAGTITVRYQ